MRWFRFYDDAINDPKILKLSDKLFRFWMGILCVASKNDGLLPSDEDIALLLRMKLDRVTGLLKELITAGLIDTDETCRHPHNWRGRQFKSDVSTERVKRFRNAHSTVSETPPDTEQRQKQKDDGDEGAGISPETLSLADDIAEIAGLGRDPKNLPPGWCGAPMRIQSWINHGWPPELILVAVRESMSRKRDGPPDTVNYFEKPIARAVAQHARPLPVVVIDQTPSVVHAKAPPHVDESRSLVAAARRAAERLRGASGLGDQPSEPVLRIISQS